MAKIITKAQHFEDLKALLAGGTPPNGLTAEDIIAFADKELALLERKKTSRKPTAVQVENEVYKTSIVEFLEKCNGATCTEMIKGIPVMREEMLPNQRVSAICRTMVEDGILVKNMIKGKAVFSLTA